MENPMFKKLIDKKKKEGKDISDVHSSAKSSVLEDLMSHLGSLGVDKIKGMKKIDIQANPKVSLPDGLDKAKELLKHTQAGEDEHDEEMSDSGPNPDISDSDEEYEGSPANESGYDQELEAGSSSEDKDAQIASLKAELAKHKMSRM